MNETVYPYDESLLQWIWQHLEFDTQSLRTECGNVVRIVDPGKQNHGSGPDFSGTIIRINNTEFHGDTELHIYPEGWVQHHHSASELFNRVILHVVYDYRRGTTHNAVTRPDGTTPPMLVLKPYLQKSLQRLLERQNLSVLPCAANHTFINQAAFEYQVEKAHQQYFEYKTNFLLSSYKPELPVSQAWLNMLTYGLFHTLGIPLNRQPMAELHSMVSEIGNLPASSTDFVEEVAALAFSDSDPAWSYTGMRPASRPQIRVRQAAFLFHAVHNMSLKEFLSPDLGAWKKVIQIVPPSMTPGGQMRKILKHTIFLPAAYILGDLLHSKQLKENAYASWRKIQGGVPKEVLSPFKESGFELNKQTRKPGLAHQLKRYCRPGNCHQCEVFKKAISS